MSIEQQPPALFEIIRCQATLCDPFLFPRLLPLTPRNEPKHRRDHQEHGEHRERATGPLAPLAFHSLDLTATPGHERWKLGAVPQLTGRIALDPSHGFGELHGVEQAGCASAALDPLGDLRFEPAASLFIRSPPLDPRSERRPSP